ncbi:MAG: tetratricopeptide repeat protein [Alphaproteobacteria bacterium]|nr:tetratricopeptide repeat protein [Alphaproteobacteria bacterium]
MALSDCRGVPLSTSRPASLEGYEAAVELLHGYFNDPLAAIDATLQEDPDFVMGHCLKADIAVMVNDRSVEPMLRESIAQVDRLRATANERERGHAAAARAWLEGDFEGALARYARVLTDYPRDSLALQVAHTGDFFLGHATSLRDRVARVLPWWNAAVPGYDYVLGMYAFGLEETADYTRAEDTGRRAVDRNPRDPWAIHAVTHVCEMQAQPTKGIDWLSLHIPDWAPDNMFACHNWWHLALFHLDADDHARALELFDTRIKPRPDGLAIEFVDGTSLLWRLWLRGVDVGARFDTVADAWARVGGAGWYAFNDAHAMMVYAAAGRWEAVARLLAEVTASAESGGTNGMMAHEVGLPLCHAIAAFGEARYDEAADLLLAVRPVAQRFGGSHAQRDVLSLTLLAAALRGGWAPLARAIAAERTEQRPASPFNWLATASALKLAGLDDAPARARAAALKPAPAVLQPNAA